MVLQPTGAVTTNSADISWTSNPGSQNYDIYYSTTNTIPATPNITGFTGTSYTIPSLNPSTTYYYWVRSNCGTAMGTPSSGNFTTACGTVNIPYSLDFESVTAPALPNCTSVVNAGSGNNWVTANSPGSGFTTKVLSYSWSSVNAANSWFFTAPINLTAGTQYSINYKYGNNSSSTYTEKMKVAYGTSNTAAGMVNVLADYPSITGATPQTATVTFTPSTTGVYYFGFNAYSIADQYSLFLDDISITQGSLGTSEVNASKNNVKVYPNPFTDVLNIADVSKVKFISIMDVSGKLVKTIDKPANALHLGDLSAGMYLVILNMNDGSKQTIKAMKK